MGVPRKVRLELVEKSPSSLVHSRRCEAVPHRRRLASERLEVTVLDELTEGGTDRSLVIDESKNVGDGDIRTEALPVQPEHDLEYFISLSEALERIGNGSIGKEPPDVVQSGFDGSVHAWC